MEPEPEFKVILLFLHQMGSVYAGVDAVTSLLQLALDRGSSMRQAAMALLMTPCLLPTVTTASAVAVGRSDISPRLACILSAASSTPLY